MKKIIAVLSLAILLCSAFSGMASAEGEIVAAKDEKVVTIEGDDYWYPTPFAHYPKGPGYIRMSFIFDTLIWKDKHGEISWLADSYSRSYDAKTWTFYLHRGVKWSDGEPFTADDVKFTFDYTKEHTQMWYVYTAEEIDHVEVLDPYTVSIHLKESRPTFIDDVAGCVPIIPEHIWKDVRNPKYFREDEAVIGTGPLKLVEYDGTQGYYEYEANEECFKGRPIIDKLISMNVGDVTQVVLALETEDIDAASFSGNEIVAVDEFRGDPDFEIKEGSSWWVLNLYFNYKNPDPKNLMKSTKFRRAIAYGINRKNLIENVTRDGSILANTGIMHPDSNWYKPDLPSYEYDPAKANETLDDFGFKDTNNDGIREYPEGGDLKFTLFTTKDYAREAESIQKDLKKVGIEIEVKFASWKEVGYRLGRGEFELAVSGHGGIVNPRVLRPIAQGTDSSEKYDEIYEQQRRTMNENYRKKLVGDLQEIIAKELPVYALYHPKIWCVYNPEKLDTWFYTKDAIAGSIPLAQNKLVFLFDPWRYDANENGIIEKSEVIDAIQDYFKDVITKEDVIDVIWLYF